MDAKEIKEHAAKGGIFGAEKTEWAVELEKQETLKNCSKEDKANKKRENASIMDRLKIL